MLTSTEHYTRAWAVMTAVADGRYNDVDLLLADLGPQDTGTLVSNLATVAVSALIPPHLRGDPAATAHAAKHMRITLLELAATGDAEQEGA